MSEESKEITQPPAETQVENKEASAQETPKNSKEYNFRRMEQKMKEMEQRLAQAEAEKQKLAPAPQQNLNDDDILTVADARKLVEREAARIAQEQLQKRDLETLQDRLQAKFPDFEQIVSEEAVDNLREEHPELFNSLKSNPDPYQKSVAAYKLIKNMKGKESKQDTAKVNSQKLEENRAKPNIAATSSSVLSQATGWVKPSKEQKNALYQEMKSLAAKRS